MNIEPDSKQVFQQRLEHLSQLKLDLIFNENSTVMLNVLERKPFYIRLSIHKLFLHAPEPILTALSHYLHGRKQGREDLQSYIAKLLPSYEKRPTPIQLIHQGAYYNLKERYDAINGEYFDHCLDLSITWFGHEVYKACRRATLGKYLPAKRLIKIHRRLDSPFFPDYFLDFVVYHEMLHSVVDGYSDKAGRFCTHGAAFKLKEKAFRHYSQAIDWEKQHIRQILYGRT